MKMYIIRRGGTSRIICRNITNVQQVVQFHPQKWRVGFVGMLALSPQLFLS